MKKLKVFVALFGLAVNLMGLLGQTEMVALGGPGDGLPPVIWKAPTR
ncbi:hypothetical protein ACWOA0_02400 [Ignavigranum ruoffiae]|uniref:Uncharacterized protein n=1 Tax=Ignavigranum ruoffiae TaxID=89093 RepID=A0A1H9DFE8_9LACT|nr:hypothetical protein [Ignavigranum ruoffiae]UPQ86260.1 hypothetical protein M0R79_02450 [Ignavigranum ruoffiae]SEQ12194.1 hypothetical protein SAMN04488558_105122 [Ignavigranum ruoffiae]